MTSMIGIAKEVYNATSFLYQISDLINFARSIGYDFTPINSSLGKVDNKIKEILLELDSISQSVDILLDLEEPLENHASAIAAEYTIIINSILAIYCKIKEFENAFDNEDINTYINEIVGDGAHSRAEFVKEFLKRTVGLLLYEHLNNQRPNLKEFLLIIGVMEEIEQRAESEKHRLAFMEHRINWNAITGFLINPPNSVMQIYQWGSGRSGLNRLIDRLHNLLISRMIPAAVDYLSFEELSEFESAVVGTIQEDEGNNEQLTIVLWEDEASKFKIVIKVVVIPKTTQVLSPGIGFAIVAMLSDAQEIPLTKNIHLIIDGGMDLESGIYLAFMPGMIPGFSLKLPNPNLSSASIILAKKKKDSSSPIVLLGSLEGSRLEIGAIDGMVGMEIFNGKCPDLFGEIQLNDGRIILNTKDADSFIERILPSDLNLDAPFDIICGWSSERGLYFRGSGSIEIIIPIHKSIGSVFLESIYIAIILGEVRKISIFTAVTVSAELGPIAASIERIGTRYELSFPEDGGNMGPVEFSIGFLTPVGAGISIDAGITGGGYLEFDNKSKRYTGILALKFREIGLTAIGLITTKMPDGSKGFAMLASMGVDFNPPIQLSMGFTLNKVGGLIGINRTMMVDVLREGIKKHTLDAILCPNPEWVIPNASKIISDLRTVFPPAEGHYVIGPMVQIGYGSPTIITADIGIFLELEGTQPKRALLLGKLKMLLPKPEEAIVKINLDIIGVLDLEKKELSFQASLYDSSILMYEIFGDAAFFLSWGAKPEFAMSLGGFHPRFAPPQPSIIFADLKRLGMNLSKGSNFQLSCGAYQAVTPNSLQFGARAELYASAGKAEISGYLSFDTLIYFSPFRFEVDIGAGVTIRYRKASLADVRISMTLCGPSAWSARGTAHVKILFFEIDVDFNITWGRDAPPALDPVNPWPHFEQALLRAESWGGLLPSSTHMVASLRKIEPDKTSAASSEEPSAVPVVVHPAGSLELRQNVVPLKTTLGKFGNAPVIGYDRFEITRLTTKDNIRIEIEDVDEFFARGQFENLSNSQKLSVPAFEKIPGGIKTKSLNRISVQGEIQSTPVRHEPIVINADRTSQRALEEGISRWDQMRILSAGSASRRSALRFGRQERFAPTGSPLVATVQERYVIVKRETLQQVDIWEGEGARVHADQALLNHLKRHPEQSGSLMVIAASEVVEAA